MAFYYKHHLEQETIVIRTIKVAFIEYTEKPILLHCYHSSCKLCFKDGEQYKKILLS